MPPATVPPLAVMFFETSRSVVGVDRVKVTVPPPVSDNVPSAKPVRPLVKVSSILAPCRRLLPRCPQE